MNAYNWKTAPKEPRHCGFFQPPEDPPEIDFITAPGRNDHEPAGMLYNRDADSDGEWIQAARSLFVEVPGDE